MEKVKQFFIIIILLITWVIFESTNAESINGDTPHTANFEYSFVSKIPILHNGRVKPLDTFARNYMKKFTKGRILKDVSAEEWLIGIVFQNTKELNRKIFNIENPDVVNALGLKWWKKHRYSYRELSEAFIKNVQIIRKVLLTDRNKLSLVKKQLLNIYTIHQDFTNLFGSLSLLLPLKIHNTDIISDIASNKKYILYQDIKSYISDKKEYIIELLSNTNTESKTKSKTENFNKLDYKQKEIINLVYLLRKIEYDRFSNLFKVVPPPWKGDKDLWFSPWEILEKGRSNIKTKELFDLWTNLDIAYRNNNSEKFLNISKGIYNKSIGMAKERVNENMLNIEVFYNNLDPFYVSLILYIITFIALLLSNIISNKLCIRIAEITFYSSIFIHLTGIILRMYIMQRPPVATLFESVLFVSFVIVFYSAIIALRKNKYIGLLSGSIAGILLLFVAKGYESEGDTMGMLVAVLDTNFWLATHVMTITIGYGCSFIVGLLAHFYLANKIINFNNIDSIDLERTLLKNLQSSILVALFFTILGTILGGIWADQSWGRFWGWDPKENGAMLLSLWLIWIIHGRFSGHFQDYAFAVVAAFTNIIVIISWFGVNLLNVGLHSYGFTGSIAFNMVIFGLLELIFIVLCIVFYKKNISFSYGTKNV